MTVVTKRDPPSLDLRRTFERPVVVISHTPKLWRGVLAPPFLALLNLGQSCALTPWSHRTGDHVLVSASTAVSLAAIAYTGRGTARELKRSWAEDAVTSRAGLMAVLGAFESVLFAAVIVAQWLPNAYLSTCQ